MDELALFGGAGGGILGGKLLEWRTRCAVEIDPYCREVLLARQRDGILPRFPIWDDIRTFDGKPWMGSIDVVSGGFPCQDISCAGKGAGLTGARSGLWFEMLRVIKEVRPRFVFAENSPNLRIRGLSTVLQGLNSLGYDARWCVLGAWHVGAPHRRNRMWILAYSNNKSKHAVSKYAKMARASELVSDADVQRRPKQRVVESKTTKPAAFKCSHWWTVEPDVGRVANGVAHRVDRLKAIGNGQVPAVAALAWEILTKGRLFK